MNTVLLAVLLGLWNGVGMVISLSGINFRNALYSGLITGLLVGDVALGFQVGAACLLMSIGFYTFGGATVPDYITGAIFGVIAGKQAGSYEYGLTMATLLGLLMTQMDILGRSTTTVFQHKADSALAANNIPSFERCFKFFLCSSDIWLAKILSPASCIIISTSYILDTSFLL